MSSGNFWDGVIQGAQGIWSNVSSGNNFSVGDAVTWVNNEYDQHISPITPWNEGSGENVLTWVNGEYNKLPESPMKTWITDSYDQYVAPITPWEEKTGENAISWAEKQYKQSDFKNTPIGGMFRHSRKVISRDAKLSKFGKNIVI